MRIQYKLTPKEFLDANRAYSGAMPRVSMTVGIVVMMMGLAMIAANVFQHQRFEVSSIVPLVVGFILALGWRLTVRSAYNNDRLLQKELEAEISEYGIRTTTDSASTELGWNAFERSSETKDLLLLHQSKRCFNIYPKRAFTPTQLDEFRALIKQHVSPPPRGIRVASMRMWVFAAVILISALLLWQVIRAGQ